MKKKSLLIGVIFYFIIGMSSTVFAQDTIVSRAINHNTTRSNKTSIVYKPGGPIRGALIKGGKINSEEQLIIKSTNNNETYEFGISEIGNYFFKILNPMQTDKGIQEAGIKRTDIAAKTTGAPLKGVEVLLNKAKEKTVLQKAVTNNDGVVEFVISEMGDYKISVYSLK